LFILGLSLSVCVCECECLFYTLPLSFQDTHLTYSNVAEI